jgi:acyl carrier protein
MNMNQQLEQIFREIFDNEEIVIQDEMTAKDIDGWDSLAQINLIIAIESEFGIRFGTNEISSLNNVGEIKRLIARKTGA